MFVWLVGWLVALVLLDQLGYNWCHLQRGQGWRNYRLDWERCPVMSHIRYLLEIQQTEMSMSSQEFSGGGNLGVVNIQMELTPRERLKSPRVGK